MELIIKDINLISNKLKDKEGNVFTIKDYTKSLEGKINGITLKGEAGEKEISIHDLKFYERL